MSLSYFFTPECVFCTGNPQNGGCSFLASSQRGRSWNGPRKKPSPIWRPFHGNPSPSGSFSAKKISVIPYLSQPAKLWRPFQITEEKPIPYRNQQETSILYLSQPASRGFQITKRDPQNKTAVFFTTPKPTTDVCPAGARLFTGLDCSTRLAELKRTGDPENGKKKHGSQSKFGTNMARPRTMLQELGRRISAPQNMANFGSNCLGYVDTSEKNGRAMSYVGFPFNPPQKPILWLVSFLLPCLKPSKKGSTQHEIR